MYSLLKPSFVCIDFFAFIIDTINYFVCALFLPPKEKTLNFPIKHLFVHNLSYPFCRMDEAKTPVNIKGKRMIRGRTNAVRTLDNSFLPPPSTTTVSPEFSLPPAFMLSFLFSLPN